MYTLHFTIAQSSHTFTEQFNTLKESMEILDYYYSRLDVMYVILKVDGVVIMNHQDIERVINDK